MSTMKIEQVLDPLTSAVTSHARGRVLEARFGGDASGETDWQVENRMYRLETITRDVKAKVGDTAEIPLDQVEPMRNAITTFADDNTLLSRNTAYQEWLASL